MRGAWGERRGDAERRGAGVEGARPRRVAKRVRK